MQAVKILFLVVAMLMVSLHISTAIFRKKVAEILGYVNLGLYISMFFIVMLLEVSLEFLALVFMMSLLVYLLSSFVSYKLIRKERDNDDV